MKNETLVTNKRDTFDRIIDRVSAYAKYYSENQHILYRPVITTSVIVNLISIALFARMVFKLGFDPLMPGEIFFWPSTWMLLPFLTIIFALAARKKLDRVEANGITLFALMLVLDLLSGHFLVFCLGAYALLNSGMREVWRTKSPNWYERLQF